MLHPGWLDAWAVSEAAKNEDEKKDLTNKIFCVIAESMKNVSSAEQRVAAHCGKAVSRVIAPLPVSGGALSEDEFRSEVVASQPSEAGSPGAESWLHENALWSFLAEVEAEHLDELKRFAEHVDLWLGEVLRRTDEEIGRASEEAQKGAAEAEGCLAQANACYQGVEANRFTASEGGSIILTPNEHRVSQDRSDCYWLYVVTDCAGESRLEESISDPARLE